MPGAGTTSARSSLTTSSPSYKNVIYSVDGPGALKGSGKVEDASSTSSATTAMTTSWAISLEPSPADGNIESSPSTPSATATADVAGS